MSALVKRYPGLQNADSNSARNCESLHTQSNISFSISIIILLFFNSLVMASLLFIHKLIIFCIGNIRVVLS